MSYKKFLCTTREYFNLFAYPLTSKHTFEFEKFQKYAVSIINRCEDFNESCELLFAFHFISKNLKKITKKIAKHSNYWDALSYKKKLKQSLSEPDEAININISNAFDDEDKDFCYTSYLLENDIFAFSKKGNKYWIAYEDCDNSCYFKRRFGSRNSFKIFSKNGNLLFNMKFKKGNPVLKKNTWDYDLYSDEYGTYVYDKEYLNASLGENKELDEEKMQAFYFTDLIKENDTSVLTRLQIYEDLTYFDEELLLNIGCILCLHLKKEINHSRNLTNFFTAFVLMNYNRMIRNR